ERQHGRGDARATGRDHGPGQIDSRTLELRPDGSGRQERAVLLIELVVWEVEAAGDVTAAEPRARLRLGPAEPPARARVEHLRLAGLEVPAHGGKVTHEAPAQARAEAAGLRRGCAGLHGAALRSPSRQSAVEDEDGVVAEGAKRPP